MRRVGRPRCKTYSCAAKSGHGESLVGKATGEFAPFAICSRPLTCRSNASAQYPEKAAHPAMPGQRDLQSFSILPSTPFLPSPFTPWSLPGSLQGQCRGMRYCDIMGARGRYVSLTVNDEGKGRARGEEIRLHRLRICLRSGSRGSGFGHRTGDRIRGHSGQLGMPALRRNQGYVRTGVKSPLRTTAKNDWPSANRFSFRWAAPSSPPRRPGAGVQPFSLVPNHFSLE